MDYQDQRKRAFSQAFQLANQPRFSDSRSQPAKRILTYPLHSMGLCYQNTDKENDGPLDLDYDSTVDEAPGTQVRHPPPINLRRTRPVLYNTASLQYELYGDGPGPEAGTSYDPNSVVRNAGLRDSDVCKSPLSTPSIVRGKSMFGPSPYLRPNLSLSLGSSADSCSQTAFISGVLENAGPPMSDATTAVNPLTPSTLKFGDLSLNSEGYSFMSSPLRQSVQGNRATVSMVSTCSFSKFDSHYQVQHSRSHVRRSIPVIHPNEVVVLFDKGKAIRKANKYALCNASRLFAQLLGGPSLDPGLTRCLRLRDDFPYAITIMLYFIETGYYVFDQRAFTRHPLLSALDYHIHAYLVGRKYNIKGLRDCAIKAYLITAQQELDNGFLMVPDDQNPSIQFPTTGFPIIAPADDHNDGETKITPVDRFLNSLALLWKNAQSDRDPMRQVVLELIKRNLSKLLGVPFFITLMQDVVGFGDDIMTSLGDDGFEVKALQFPKGGRPRPTFYFDI
ncbi:hypothetical protein C7974DRAFT_671 [Boeremia exigua]|uniref:uncharacterized protein n=1 Tax=Boeremia exigua TaxID=749465 RepID=UPI001E8ED7AF|nr:uncharacterized protein C7974DRAFT_671 [Boeremia exigua]KAH6643552.1 hypothetical protein C7974DRAFT_671 [Boeremia exigua]